MTNGSRETGFHSIFRALFQRPTLKRLLTFALFFVPFALFSQQVDWVDFGGGGWYDVGSGIASDKAGNSYSIGTVYSTTTYNPRFGNDTLRAGQNYFYEGWIAKYTLQGNREWVHPVGGTSSDLGTDIEMDTDTSFIAVGLYRGSNATFDTITGPAGTGVKLFVARFDTAFNVQWVEAAQLGNIIMSPFSRFYNPTVAINDSGDVYIHGVFRQRAIFNGTDTLNASSSTDYDAFLAKFDVNGNYKWSMSMGGTNFNYAGSVATDNDGNAYVSGQFFGTMSIDTISLTASGSWDGFLAKINDTAEVQWAHKLGGIGQDDAFGVSIDKFDNLYCGGRFTGTGNFDTISMTANGVGFWASDVYLTRWNTDGEIQWAEKGGGTASGFDYLYALDTDDRGNVGITGQFGGAEATFGSWTISGNGAWRAVYFALADSTGDFTWAVSGHGSSFAFNQGNGISIDSAKNIYVTGQGDPPLVFGDVVWATGNGLRDAFVVKVSDCSEADTAEIYSDSVITGCLGDTVKLWSNNAAHLEYRWLHNGNGIFLADDSTYGAYFSGTYRVAISDDGCKDTSDPIQVTISALPNVNMSSLGTICVSDGQTTLSQGTPAGGVYKGIGMINDTVFDPTVSGQGSFLIWYVYQDTSTGCSDSTFGQIIVSSASATLPVFADMCTSDPPLTLSGGSPLGGTYYLNGASVTSFDPSAAGAGDHDIEYVVFNGPCSDTAVRTIHVDTAPTVSLTSLADVCVSTVSVALSGGSPAGGTFSGPGVAFNNFFPSFAGGVGTYTITYTYTDGNGCDGSATQSITVDPNFTIAFNPTTNYCPGASDDTLSATPVGGTFSGPGVSGNIFSPSTAGVGSHSVQYKYTNSCKSDSVSQTITVNAGPTVSLSAIPAQCVGNDPITLTQGTPIGGTYSGPGVSGTSFDPDVAGAGTHTIKYIYTDGSSCTDSATTTAVVNALPNVSFTSLSDVCADAAPFSLSGGSPTGGTYSGTGVSGGNFNPGTAGVGSHTITYVFTDGNSCTDSASQVQVVDSVPVVSFAALSDICVNAIPLTLSGGSPTGGTYTGTGVSGGSFNPASAGTGSHSLTYSYTDANGCSDDATSSITVDPSPTVTISSISSLCAGDNAITLTQGSPSGGTYFGTGVSGGSFNPTTAGAGTHTVGYTFTDGSGCSDTATTSVTVFGQPSVTLSSLSAVCIDASSLTLTGGSPSGGTYSGTGVSAGSFNPSTAGVGSHIITYVYTDGNTCTDSASQTQVVNALPTVTFGSLSDVCLNANPVTLSQGSPAGGTYSGTGVSGGTFNPASAGAGTYTLTYSYTDGNGCSDDATSSITVDPQPTVTIGAISSLCEGANSITLSSGSPSGGVYFGTGVSGTTFNPATAGAGTHTIGYTYTDGNGCSDSASTTVTVFGQPTVSLASLSPVCADASPFTLSGASPSGGSFSGTGVLGTTFTPSAAGVGSHTITYTYTDGNSCTDSASQVQVVDSLPVVNFASMADLCLNSTPITLNQGSPSGGTYSGTAVSGGTFHPGTSGTGSFTLSYSFTDGNGCSSSDTESITVNALPNVTFSSLSALCAADNSISLTQGSPSGGTYFGAGVSSGSFDPNSVGAGTYSLGYFYTDGNSCRDTANQSIVVNAQPTVTFGTLTDVCVDAASFSLSSGSPSGGTYSGTAVSSGSFDPASAGVGVFALNYVFTDGNGCTDSASSNQTVDSLPVVTFSTIPNVCLNGSPVTLSQGTPTGGTYSGTAVSSGVFSPATAGTGTFNLTYDYTDGNGCSSSDNQDITVDTLPTITFGAIPDVCFGGDPVALTQGAPAGGTYYGNGVVNDTLFPATAGTGSHILGYFASDGNGCSDTAFSSVLINTQPTVTLGSLSNVCANSDTFSLSGGSPAGGTYSGTAVSSGIFDPVSAGSGSYTITYMYTDGASCTDSATQSITVDTVPIINFTALSNVCDSAPGFTLSSASPLGGTYSGSGVKAGSFDPASVGPGTYTIQYAFTDGNSCSDSSTQNITVDTLPMVTFSSLPASCFGDDPVVLNQGSPVGGNYNGTGIVSGDFDPDSAGVGLHNLTYVFTDGNGCVDSASQLATVNALPIVSVSAIGRVCWNEPGFQLTQGSPAGGSYSGLRVSNDTLIAALDPALGLDTVFYTYTDLNGCTDSSFRRFLVDSVPNVQLSGLGSYCFQSNLVSLTQGSPVGGTYSGMGVNSSTSEFDPSTGTGMFNVQYVYTDGNNCSDSTVAPIVVDTLPDVRLSKLPRVCEESGDLLLTGGSPLGGNFSGPGVFAGTTFNPDSTSDLKPRITYRFTDLNGCADSAFRRLTVDTLPDVSVTYLDTICRNSGLDTLRGGLPMGGFYKGDGILQDSLFDPSTVNVGSYDLRYVVTTAFGCTDSADFSALVHPDPSSSWSFSEAICENDSLMLLSGGSPVGGMYFGPGVQDSLFNPAVIGVGNDSIFYTASNYCGADTSTGYVAVLAKPFIAVLDTLDACPNGGLYSLEVASPAGGLYLGNSIVGDSLLNPTGLAVGLQTFQYTYDDGSCRDTIDFGIEIHEIPDLNVSLDTSVCVANALELRLDNSFTDVVWNGVVNGNDQNILAKDLNMGGNPFTVEAKQGGLCSGLHEFTVTVFPCSTFEVMPNPTEGDFILRINAMQEEEIEVSIINARGQIILTHHEMLKEGLNHIPYDLQGMDGGLYLIQARGQFLDETQKLFLK
jgi:hypothetical protein